MLVDDTAANFVPNECSTGHCLLVPTFGRPQRGSCFSEAALSLDDVFRVPDSGTASDTEDALLDSLLPSSSSSDGTPLFSALRSFVAACDACRHELEEMNAKYAATPHAPPTSGGPFSSEQCGSRLLSTFSFLAHAKTSHYREHWHRLHEDHGDALALPLFLSE